MIHCLVNDIERLDYRFERKFVTSRLSPHQIDNAVKMHAAHFREVYSVRDINSLYLDTLDKKSYFDHSSGINERVKVRVRWYGDLYGQTNRPHLEFKLKRGAIVGKATFPLDSFRFEKGFKIGELRKIMENSDVPAYIKEDLRGIHFASIIRYTRKYYLSRDRNFRLTVDWGLRSLLISPSKVVIINDIWDRHNSIIELKYPTECDIKARNVLQNLPFSITKHSKYISGLERSSMY